jgi:acetyltransferase, GNAT family
MNLDNLSFLRVTKGFVFKPFNCEDDDLNEFLFEEAIPYRKELLATTFVIEDDTRTLGYYSLLNDSLQLKEEMFSSKSQLKKFLRDLIPYPKRHLKNIPSVKIGRLAVDKSCKGKGLGKIMIHTIISNCLMLNDNQAIPFYQRMGFEFLSDNDKEDSTRLMFLDLADLEE